MNGYKQWYQAYSDIMDYLHGKNYASHSKMTGSISTKAAFLLTNGKSSKDWSRIVIDYDLDHINGFYVFGRLGMEFI